MKIILSIIIPFYNTGKYIEECLNSLLDQDIPQSTYEIICINDASTDNTVDYVEKFRNIYSNIRILHHSNNRQQGAARNYGFKHANGKYIWFVDSDDYIKSNVLSKLLKYLEVFNLDLLHFNSLKVFESQTFERYKYYECPITVETGIGFLKKYVPEFRCISTESCFKLFKRSFLVQNQILFPEGVYFEDAVFSMQAFIKAERMVYIPDEIYFYRIHSFSTMAEYTSTPVKQADWITLIITSISLIKPLKSLEQNAYKILTTQYISNISISRINSFSLNFRDQIVFHKRLQRNNVLGSYYFILITYPYIFFNQCLNTFLAYVKTSFPNLWRRLKIIHKRLSG